MTKQEQNDIEFAFNSIYESVKAQREGAQTSFNEHSQDPLMQGIAYTDNQQLIDFDYVLALLRIYKHYFIKEDK